MDENNQSEQTVKKPTTQEKAQQTIKDSIDVGAPLVAAHFGGPLASEAVEEALATKKGQQLENKVSKALTGRPLSPARFTTTPMLAKLQKPVEKLKPVAKSTLGMINGNPSSSTKLGKNALNATNSPKIEDAAKGIHNTNVPSSSATNTSNSSGGGFGSRLKKSLFNNTGAVGAVADYNSTHNTATSGSGIDIIDGIVTFIKNNPGLIFAIFAGLLITAIMFLPIIIFASAVMYVINAASNVADSVVTGWINFWESTWNALTGNGFKPNESVYFTNLEEASEEYFKDSSKIVGPLDTTSTKVKYYINAAALYSSIINPDALVDENSYDKAEDEVDDKDEIDDENQEVEKTEEETIENEDDIAKIFIGTSEELKSKYASIKGDPKELVDYLFECEDTSEEGKDICTFSEEHYKEELMEKYIPRRFIDCDKCGFENATEEQKKSAAKKMAEEIISQARSAYFKKNTSDQSNYTAYNIMVSGITVKDSDGNVIGTYSFSEYIQAIVERDAGEYNIEIKKAYALVIISNTLANSSNGEVTEDDFNFDKIEVTQSTIDAVEAVIDLKIMKDGKVFSAPLPFDFEAAQQVVPQEYEAILEALYGEDISIEESISDGLQLDPDTGFYMRVQPPSNVPGTESYENYFGSRSVGLIGECAWYATNRAREITQTMQSTTIWTGNANGSGFCDLHKSQFERCYPGNGTKCEITQATIISWKGLYDACPDSPYGCGHVAIVEQVTGNGTYLISDAAVTKGGYAIANNYKLNDVWEAFRKGEVTRLENCLYDKGGSYTGCVSIRPWTQSEIDTYLDGVRCYVYLDKPITS